MATLAELYNRIENRNAVLGVIGLGYVGLPLAAVFADAGFRVIGVDLKTDRIDKINAGSSPIEGREPGLAELLERVVSGGPLSATSDYSQLSQAEVVLISVETPVDEDHIPHFKALANALASLGPNLKEGALVIVESTIAPGTMDRLVRPLLEKASGRRVSQGFYLGHCPERVMPGKLLHNLRNVSRVCGGYTPDTSQAMIALYRTIVDADLDPADSLTAELVKTAENAYRDVNIAFANELALICQEVGGDVWKVRELVNKSPDRNVLLPGGGVGGHCIPKDPWLLAYAARSSREPLRLIPAARAVNDSMPGNIADLTANALAGAGKDIARAKILVLGYAYLENSDDDRNSPTIALVDRLQELGAKVVVQDPYIGRFQGDVANMARGKDALVLMVAHDEYRDIALESLGIPLVIDGRGFWRGAVVNGKKVSLRLIGQGSSKS